jgi:hypothetical protein
MSATDGSSTTSSGTDTSGSDGAGDSPSIEELQENIEQTRAELGETVDALSAKLDVKGRTKQRLSHTKDQAGAKVHDTSVQVGAKVHDAQVKASQIAAQAKDKATDEQGKPKPAVLGGAGAVAAVLVAGVVLLVWRRAR